MMETTESIDGLYNQAYDEGFIEGKADGEESGYEKGYADGRKDAHRINGLKVSPKQDCPSCGYAIGYNRVACEVCKEVAPMVGW